MKNYFKTSKTLRWAAAGVFGLMLALNIMVSLDFEKGKLLPSLTLVELGNQAFARGEDPIYESCEDPNSVAHHLPDWERKYCPTYNVFDQLQICDPWLDECCPIPNNPPCPPNGWIDG